MDDFEKKTALKSPSKLIRLIARLIRENYDITLLTGKCHPAQSTHTILQKGTNSLAYGVLKERSTLVFFEKILYVLKCI